MKGITKKALEKRVKADLFNSRQDFALPQTRVVTPLQEELRDISPIPGRRADVALAASTRNMPSSRDSKARNVRRSVSVEDFHEEQRESRVD